MSTSPVIEKTVDGDGTVVEAIRKVGEDLSHAIGAVLRSLPAAAQRPNGLAKELGVNRAVASRVLNATSRRDGLEVVNVIPGPEPLRQLVAAAAAREVAADLTAAASAAVERFDELIRNEAGTRSALDALISASLPGAREKFELSSRYSVFKGISQLRGARAETWLGTAIVSPAASDPLKHDLTWLNGAVAMQRLRPGVTVRFSYRHRTEGDGAEGDGAPADLIELEQFCTNPPAQLVAQRAGKVINYVLPPDLLGPRSVTDMFVVDHHPAAMRRFAREAPHTHSSLFVEPAMPVAMLVFDVLLHEEAFPGAAPELIFYDTGYDGIANVNDTSRDIDRVDLQESVEFLGHDMRDVYASEVPRYADILAHLCNAYGWDPARFRGYRLRMQYPVYGWQVCMAFAPPPAP
ncbi:MAG: hypothetical protein ACYTGP_05425 [Planctomycetota bacterium]|jgi:hypothetical protein